MDSETNNDNYYEYEYLDECLEISTGSSLTEMISMSQQQPSFSANIRSRKSYTLETKLKIFEEFDPHNKNSTLLVLSRKYSIPLTNLNYGSNKESNSRQSNKLQYQK
ncbi:hypothetical protein PVAND_012460 [Polypedilum vanderplanki]|uniref:Uncharacterized protein n=1 Tax=Polypedilum vanderplanki TaxID=319348 RepID=A0A9J6CNG3_POLVA|nr:hypothetical protein PVAND_012460 [Polypedilum vanderplanki]